MHHWYRSSCVLEALKAKLRDWDNVELHCGMVPSTANPKKTVFHMWWSKGYCRYHFYPREPVGPLSFFWHTGRIIRLQRPHKGVSK